MVLRHAESTMPVGPPGAVAQWAEENTDRELRKKMRTRDTETGLIAIKMTVHSKSVDEIF